MVAEEQFGNLFVNVYTGVRGILIGVSRFIDGREYWIITSHDGDSKHPKDYLMPSEAYDQEISMMNEGESDEESVETFHAPPSLNS